MTPDEIARLLGYISAALSRPVPDEGTVAAWTPLLADMPVELARQAAKEHLKASPHWPTPAELRARARQIADRRRERSAHQRALERAREDADRAATRATDGGRMVAWVLAETRARLAGVTDPEKRSRMVGEILAEWRAQHPAPVAGPRDRTVPCTNPGCRCTHTDGCVAGWTVVVKPDGTEQAGACPQCNWRRHTILTSGQPREVALARLRASKDEEGDEW